MENTMVMPHDTTRRFARIRSVAEHFSAICLLVFLASCGASNPPNERALDQQLMNVTTSAVPGAQATVLAPPAGTGATGQNANFCVTDAGYCPLAAATPAGENCLCKAGGLAYGGQTGAAPQTVKYNAPLRFLGSQGP